MIKFHLEKPIRLDQILDALASQCTYSSYSGSKPWFSGPNLRFSSVEVYSLRYWANTYHVDKLQ